MTDNHHITDDYDGGAELAIRQQPTSRTVDLRDRATDSWTDVFDDLVRFAQFVNGAEGLLPKQYDKPGKILAGAMMGRELGFSPMTALRSIHVIEGNPSLSAEMMRALILQGGHELQIVESTRDRCKIRGRRRGSEEWTEATWTIQEANQTQVFISKAQGWGPLSGKSQWKSWPTEMLLARATTRLARMLFPDVIHGLRTSEELHDMATTEVVDAEAVDGPPAPQPVQRRRAPRPTPRPTQQPAPDTEPATQAETVDEETGEVQPQQPAEVVRRRKARPAPRPAASEPVENHAEATSEAEVDVLPDEPAQTETVDAEVVDDLPADLPADQPFRAAITIALMHFKRLAVEDRAERLWLTGEVVGRPVASTNDLTLDEARALAHLLERQKDLAALQATIDHAKAGS